tara:strand:- start:8815 stop:9546 length:732 start_codon:yes stop_codon:yes gene_type:complete
MGNDKKWIEFIRNQELECIKEILIKSNNKKILEIGGKNGYFAKILTDWGFEVISIDIEPANTYFNVKKMNATDLEFKSNMFDVILSSHVIAHIENKKLLFKEINRVLKTNGVIIHIVPSNWWSIITNFWHYILLPKYLFQKNKKNKSLIKNEVKIDNYKKNRIKNLLLYHPLGVDKSFIVEIIKFSKKNWKNLFISFEYIIDNELNGPLVYSGYDIFKNKGYKLRKYFARIIPSSYIFIINKK